MKNTTVFLVQLAEPMCSLSQKAAAAVFPQAEFILANTAAEAAQTAVQGRQLLVLGDANEAEINAAAQIMDGEDLPRWAVVAIGGNSSDLVESILPAECNTQLLGRVFRASVLQHELLRENLGLRGDLKTIARRFSHDLRSPLNCIHITCELMKELSASNGSSLKPQIEVVQDALSETFEIIDCFSYVLKATTEPIPATVLSMDTVVNRVLSQLADEIHQARLTIEHPASWPQVRGSLPWLEEIWRNLILNAIQHSLPVAPIQLGWSDKHGAWRFWVENQGAPVPANLQTQFFRRFEQLHARSTSGLGLTMVQRLVALQGGHCGYEQVKAGSSVFYFTLPL
jgi:signal transduction histidine kinase